MDYCSVEEHEKGPDEANIVTSNSRAPIVNCRVCFRVATWDVCKAPRNVGWFVLQSPLQAVPGRTESLVASRQIRVTVGGTVPKVPSS